MKKTKVFVAGNINNLRDIKERFDVLNDYYSFPKSLENIINSDIVLVSDFWNSDENERLYIFISQKIKKKIFFAKNLKEFNYHLELKSVKLNYIES